MNWVREEHNCVTPTEVAIGLSSSGGLPNTVVELVEHHRHSLLQISSKVSVFEKQLRRICPRASEVRFAFVEGQGYGTSGSVGIPDFDYCPDFGWTVFEYSGVGSGQTVLCSPRRRTCVPRGDNRDTQFSFEDDMDEDNADDKEMTSNTDALQEIGIDAESAKRRFRWRALRHGHGGAIHGVRPNHERSSDHARANAPSYPSMDLFDNRERFGELRFEHRSSLVARCCTLSHPLGS